MSEIIKPQIPMAIPIADLRKMFPDRIVAPSDPDYDRARSSIYGGVDRHPAAFIRPTTAEQVALAVTLARQTGVEFTVRGGGHSLAIHSLIDDGYVLDLAGLTDLQIDSNTRTAWAQSGLTTGVYTTAANKLGLATGFGDTATVGLGGLTLGGGMGYLVRKYGLTVDQLLAAEIVTADGKILYTDPQSHPDLFWALRGGGGNFGVVTRFKYQLHPVDLIFGGMIIFPATADVIAGIVDFAASAPEELSLILNVMKAPPMPFLPPEVHGQWIAMVGLVFAGNPTDGDQVVAPLRALAVPLRDMLHAMPYPQMFMAEESDFRPCVSSRSRYFPFIDRIGAQAILERLRRSTAMMAICQLRVLGGAVSRVPDDATAYNHRKHQILANFVAVYLNPQDAAEQEAWTEETVAALPTGGDNVYVNFLGPVGSDGVQHAYPGVWERLTQVKAQYDPDNFFRGNHNIPPARL